MEITKTMSNVLDFILVFTLGGLAGWIGGFLAGSCATMRIFRRPR